MFDQNYYDFIGGNFILYNLLFTLLIYLSEKRSFRDWFRFKPDKKDLLVIQNPVLRV